MSENRYNTPRPLTMQMKLDTGKVGGIIGEVVRKAVAERLRAEGRSLGCSVSVAQGLGGSSLITLTVPGTISEEQQEDMKDKFKGFMDKIGAVASGQSPGKTPAGGLLAILANKGIA